MYRVGATLNRTVLLCFAVLVVSLFAFGQTSGERRVVRKITPVYPAIAKRLHLAGTVRLAVTVKSNGTVREIKELGGHPLLIQAATQAAAQWQFEPGQEETLMLQIEFKLP